MMYSSDDRFTPPSVKIDSRIKTILSRLSLEEKIDLLGGASEGKSTQGNEQAGIPAFRMADGPVGVHWWTEASTVYPALICAAATWDCELIGRMGRALGRDCRARGIHILLAPGVNIYRAAFCGRNFEYLGEDPFLSSAMVVPYIEGVQSQGVSATVKHYALNFQEYDRHNISSDVEERTLHEIYLPAFKAAVEEAGCGCVMSAYNLVNSIHCSENNELLNEILKKEWKFDGVVMSDWISTYSAVDAANSGLDLEMPGAEWLNREYLLPAVKDGRVSKEVIDDKIRRLVRLGLCFGWFDNEQLDSSIPEDDPETASVALDIARNGIVLLKNEDNLLPLESGAVQNIAVIGPHAAEPVICGGGSAYTSPNHVMSIMDGLRMLIGDAIQIRYYPGLVPWPHIDAFFNASFTTPDGRAGLHGEYFRNDNFEGTPDLERVDEHICFKWANKAPAEGFEKEGVGVRWRGSFTPEESGVHTFFVHCPLGEYCLRINGKEILNYRTGPTRDEVQSVRVPCREGVRYELELGFIKSVKEASIRFGYQNTSMLERWYHEALEGARSADVVVYATGFVPAVESEGYDRSFGLPQEVDTFINRLADVNPCLVLTLHAGGNVDMRAWFERVKALLHVWYPGQEGGAAIAEILLGLCNPSGKLPATFEKQPQDRSSFDCYHPENGAKRVTLTDTVFGGYRHHDKTGIAPRFPFGFGLSYTTFAYENISLSNSMMSAEDTQKVTFDIVNTGSRSGAEIAQVYIGCRSSVVPRPVKELKGFVKVYLDAGERKTVHIDIVPKTLAFYDSGSHEWQSESGTYDIYVGASSADIRLTASFELIG
ncbi:MAG: hypothetical protein GF350_02320 [Chitinivibrionales bacterium]|nr:hypothetical protein [Chitinivibrionales bacterium]